MPSIELAASDFFDVRWRSSKVAVRWRNECERLAAAVELDVHYENVDTTDAPVTSYGVACAKDREHRQGEFVPT